MFSYRLEAMIKILINFLNLNTVYDFNEFWWSVLLIFSLRFLYRWEALIILRRDFFLYEKISPQESSWTRSQLHDESSISGTRKRRKGVGKCVIRRPSRTNAQPIISIATTDPETGENNSEYL